MVYGDNKVERVAAMENENTTGDEEVKEMGGECWRGHHRDGELSR